MDRSLVFTALLELDPAFGKLTTDEAERRVTVVLAHHTRMVKAGTTTGTWQSTQDFLRAEAGAEKTFGRVWAGREDWI